MMLDLKEALPWMICVVYALVMLSPYFTNSGTVYQLDRFGKALLVQAARISFLSKVGMNDYMEISSMMASSSE